MRKTLLIGLLAGLLTVLMTMPALASNGSPVTATVDPDPMCR